MTEIDIEIETGTYTNIERLAFVYDECILPNISQIFSSTIWILTGTLGFNYLSRKASSIGIFHLLSISFGIFITRYGVFDFELTVHFLLVVLSCFLIVSLIMFLPIKIKPYIIMLVVSSYMLLGEILHPNKEVWFRIRGMAMLVCMKSISYGFSFEKQKVAILPFFGYILFPGNVLFGPWTTFEEYVNMHSIKRIITVKWYIKVFLLFTYSICLLWFSNCILPLITLDPFYNSWPKAFVDAFSFRMGHYFVMMLAELTITSSGFSDGLNLNLFSFTWIQPMKVEFPRSTLSIVVNWNIAIHSFLKKYVFQKLLLKTGKAVAILTTYLFSSLLHGINVPVGSVLISLGLFSYVELQMREFLSKRLNACVRSRKCSSTCSHEIKAHSLVAILINDGFSLLALIQLAYTGCVMHNHINQPTDMYDSLNDVLTKWASFGYFCHYLAFIMLGLTF